MGTYLEEHMNSGLKVGDKVRVLRAFTDEEYPLICWVEEMHLCVGEEGEVYDVNESGASWVSFAHDKAGWVFPSSVLEKI